MENTLQQDEIRQQVSARYGKIAEAPSRGSGCCGDSQGCGAGPERLGYAPGTEASVPEGSEMGLGCGNPLALASIRPGETVVDLGSGGGFDCFLAAKETGPSGRVIGVDMTREMISKARANAAKGNYPNVEFRLGEIENLPVGDATADLIISNCVINLSPDKPRAIREAFRVLKPGGRLALSDIVALRPLPESLRQDVAAYTGCVAGASLASEVETFLRQAGFEEVSVKVKDGSRALIEDYALGKNGGDSIASANITARKPA